VCLDVLALLEETSVSAFPPIKIDRAMSDEPTALWHVYVTTPISLRSRARPVLAR
jgi:hypothetical protein